MVEDEQYPPPASPGRSGAGRRPFERPMTIHALMPSLADT